jgi:hypothetical protein
VFEDDDGDNVDGRDCVSEQRPSTGLSSIIGGMIMSTEENA